LKTINDLFDLIKKSDVTLIGYTFQDERIKDEFISNLNYVDVGQIDSSFSLKSFLRSLRLDSVLENKLSKSPDYILIDVGNIIYDSKDIGSKRNNIRIITEKLRSEIYSDISVYPATPKIRILITSSVYKSNTSLEFNGGNTTLFTVDLAMTINESKIKVIKNRFGMDGDEILYSIQQQIVEF
jgi:hypothetical protein